VTVAAGPFDGTVSAGGAPVVLVHGFAGSASRTWGPAGWPELLADSGRRVVTVDLLGHGDGPHPHTPEAYQQLEDHAAAQLPDEPCDAIGFSLGAKVLLTLATREPQRFRRLVLAGLGDNAFATDRDERLADLLESDHPAELAPQARYFRDQMAEGDPRALAAYLRRPGHGPLDEATLGTIVVPVLLVLGDRDFVGSGDRLLAALPVAQRIVLRGVDHFATPKSFGFLDAALDFLQRDEGAAAAGPPGP
jgi:pimeloyl-ACP methyl ester carboxylesterase